MTLTDDDIRARVETRLKAINADLEVFAKLTAEKEALETLLETGSITLAQMAFLAPLLAGPVVDVSAVEPAEPVKTKTKQNEPGSKAWLAGRKAHDAGKTDVDPLHGAETVAAEGYQLGWQERQDEVSREQALANHVDNPAHIPQPEQDFHQRLVEATPLRTLGDDSHAEEIIESKLRLK